MIYTRNAQEKSWLRWAVILLFVMTMSDVYGQWGFGGDGGSPAPAGGDTTAPAADAGGGGWGSEGGGAADEPAIKKAPYIRFIPPYDSMREIIFYENIIEDEACEKEIKEETKATTRCLPFSDKIGSIKDEAGACIKCGKNSTHKWLFAQAY